MRALSLLLAISIIAAPSPAAASQDDLSQRLAALEREVSTLRSAMSQRQSNRSSWGRFTRAAASSAPRSLLYPAAAAFGVPMFPARISGGGGGVALGDSPTWTGAHTFSADAVFNGGTAAVTVNGQMIVDGTADEIQLRIQGNATQTALPFVVENSAGTDVFTVDNTGAIAIEGTTPEAKFLTVPHVGGISSTGSLTLKAVGTNSITIASGGSTLLSCQANCSQATMPTGAIMGDGTYLQVQTDAGAPTAGDCDAAGEAGRLSLDTTNNRLYVCNGATRLWDYVALTD